MSNELIIAEVQSEYDELVAEVQKLKDEIASLTAEKDDLELHICRELQAEYDHKIGVLEFEITKYNLEIEKLRSVIEYMQAAVNRGEQVTREEAEKNAEEKLHDFYEDLDRTAQKIKKEQEYAKKRWEQDKENAREYGYNPFDADFDWEEFFKFIHITISHGESSVDEEEGEILQDSAKKNINPDDDIKSLYHKIVKALHPDMNPDITEREKELLDKAIKAYSEGDVETLREIAEIINDADIRGRFEDTPDGIAGLKELKEQLIVRRNTLESDIEIIKNSFPYNMVDFLADDDAVEARQQELQRIIESCKNTITVLNERIELLQKQMEADRCS